MLKREKTNNANLQSKTTINIPIKFNIPKKFKIRHCMLNH